MADLRWSGLFSMVLFHGAVLNIRLFARVSYSLGQITFLLLGSRGRGGTRV